MSLAMEARGVQVNCEKLLHYADLLKVNLTYEYLYSFSESSYCLHLPVGLLMLTHTEQNIQSWSPCSPGQSSDTCVATIIHTHTYMHTLKPQAAGHSFSINSTVQLRQVSIHFRFSQVNTLNSISKSTPILSIPNLLDYTTSYHQHSHKPWLNVLH